MESSPHVLLIVDDIALARGGISSIHRGIVQFMQHTVRGYNKQNEDKINLKISCLTTSPTRNVNSLNGVDVISPEVCNQPRSLSHLVHGDELFSDKLFMEKLSDVTSVILFAYNLSAPKKAATDGTLLEVHEGTVLCAVLEKLVGRVKKYSKYVNKVILINLLNLSSISFKEVFDEVGFVFNVGTKVHSVNNKFVEGKGKGSKILYPLFPTLVPLEQPHSDSLGHFVVITYVSKKTMDDPHFLLKCQKCIKTLKKEFQEGGQTKSIKWEVYFANECPRDISEADVLKNFAEEKLDRFKVASICIVHGDFETDVYSGLELLLSGIPTLVMKGTDTHLIMTDLATAAAAAYFCLPSASDTKWEVPVRELLGNLKNAETEAKRFAQEYRKNTLVRKGLEDLVKDSCNKSIRLEEIPSVLDSDDLTTPPNSSSTRPALLRLDPRNNTAKVSTYRQVATHSDETIPKQPSNATEMHELESVQSDGGDTLDPESIVLVFCKEQRNAAGHVERLQSRSGHLECDGLEGRSDFNTTGSQPEGGARRKTKDSPKDAQGDSDEKSGDDDVDEHCTSRVHSAKVSTGQKSSSSKSSNSLFTTRKYPKSEFERKMRRIKKEAEKPVKSKKKHKEKK